jgi:mRNA interferase MazF
VTSNLRLGAMPGNVRLRSGEAGLSKPSVVNVSQLTTVDRARLGERIGALSAVRLGQVLEGLGLLFGLAVEAS